MSDLFAIVLVYVICCAIAVPLAAAALLIKKRDCGLINQTSCGYYLLPHDQVRQ